jgi:hypothetical protein
MKTLLINMLTASANAEEALAMLADADDRLSTINRYLKHEH